VGKNKPTLQSTHFKKAGLHTNNSFMAILSWDIGAELSFVKEAKFFIIHCFM